MPITPIGIWSTANAIVNADTAPSATPVASDVITTIVIWLALEAQHARPHQDQELARLVVREVDARRAYRKPGTQQRRHLDSEKPERAGDDADREAGHAHAVAQAGPRRR